MEQKRYKIFELEPYKLYTLIGGDFANFIAYYIDDDRLLYTKYVSKNKNEIETVNYNDVVQWEFIEFKK